MAAACSEIAGAGPQPLQVIEFHVKNILYPILVIEIIVI
jgi:hypothetical protein